MNNKKKKTISHLIAVIEHLVMFTQNYIKKKKKKKMRKKLKREKQPTKTQQTTQKLYPIISVKKKRRIR